MPITVSSNWFVALEMIEEVENEVVNVEEEEDVEEVFAEELGDKRSSKCDDMRNALQKLVSGESLGVKKCFDDGEIGKNYETEDVDDIDRGVWTESDLDDRSSSGLNARGESHTEEPWSKIKRRKSENAGWAGSQAISAFAISSGVIPNFSHDKSINLES
ncbi:OLC1v1013277C1 [Oldenlandia corymbosa var. corymbosa]|uniref:OLC1v1013277C1 n=1 Tax=Oldenlandia corymbosa var. corymbosa TaxID=529605 RepID=A0AAV1E1A8_OLDCO|nr:OLC1v1013277C1 [Oldenlandia corymbosa var. corymbosa]